jgi:iron(III) transport system permease protein
MNTLAPALTAILTSLGVAVVTAAVATGLALLIAQALPRAASGADRGARLDQLTQLPVAVPPILVGIALIGLWNRPATGWLYDSLAILVLGNLARFLPFAIRMIHAGLRQIDPALEEAAWLASPRRSRIIGRIILPLSRRALGASFLIMLVLTMGELSLTLLVVPPGVETLPVRIYNLMHYGAEETVAALSLILLAVQLGLCLLVLVAVGWTRGERA